MVRAAGKRYHVAERIVNIGFMGERYEREIKAFKSKIEHNGDTYKFVCDHEQSDSSLRYGRWVKLEDEVSVNV